MASSPVEVEKCLHVSNKYFFKPKTLWIIRCFLCIFLSPITLNDMNMKINDASLSGRIAARRAERATIPYPVPPTQFLLWKMDRYDKCYNYERFVIIVFFSLLGRLNRGLD